MPAHDTASILYLDICGSDASTIAQTLALPLQRVRAIQASPLYQSQRRVHLAQLWAELNSAAPVPPPTPAAWGTKSIDEVAQECAEREALRLNAEETDC